MTTRRLLFALLGVALVAGAFVLATLPASAQLRTFRVKLATGQIITVSVDVPSSMPASEVPLPGQLIQEITPTLPSTPSTPSVPSLPTPSSPSSPSAPPSRTTGGGSSGGGGGSTSHSGGGSSTPSSSHKGHRQQHSGSRQHASTDNSQAQAKSRAKKRKRSAPKPTKLRNPDGTPAPTNPTFFDAL